MALNKFITNLLGDKAEPVLNTLQAMGVEAVDDLEFLQPETDLSDVLNIIQSRKLAKQLKLKFEKGNFLSFAFVTPCIKCQSYI